MSTNKKLSINSNKPLIMTSLQIAELTNKEHKDVMRDIRVMLDALGIESSAQNCAVLESSYKASNGKNNPMYLLDEELTLTLTSGYSIIQRNAIIKQWQAMREVLESTRYRLNNTANQLIAMTVIHDNLPEIEQRKSVNYMMANCVVDKVVSSLHGFPKMLKKAQMNVAMLSDREIVLADYVKLFEIGFDNHRVNELLHEKYLTDQAA